MQEKTDLRVIKTKKILFDSLLKLMKKKNFEKIKISDICEESLVNRSTFYAHYEDKYDLLMGLFEEQKIALLKELKDNENMTFSKEYLMEMLSILIDAIERDVSDRLKNNNGIIVSNLPLDTIVKFYAGGLINIGITWITRNEKYSKEELLSYIDKLIPDKI